MKFKHVYGKRNIIYEICLPKNIITWILNHIKHPITGYEHKTSRTGGTLNRQEQLSETHYQLMVIASDFYSRGASEEKIIDILSNFRKNIS